MNKKLLNETNILNELKGGSSFFTQQADSPVVAEPQKHSTTAPVVPLEIPATVQPDTSSLLEENPQIGQPVRLARKIAANKACTDASMLARYPENLIDEIRKIVKSTGKEVSFVRLTPEEKKQLVDIVYTYKSQGVKTSETEINRIAVNFMLEDYRTNGEASVLSKVIAALLA